MKGSEKPAHGWGATRAVVFVFGKLLVRSRFSALEAIVASYYIEAGLISE
jgi:hypothetical protein